MTNPIYIQNKYNTWYHNIIATAQLQDRVKGNGTYYENHHIIPKSFGGSNSKENLILLTAREHFICHALLVRFTKNENKSSMIYAFHRLCVCNEFKNSRLYESNKIKFSKLQSENMKGNKNGNANRGKKLSEDHKKKIGIASKIRKHTRKTKEKTSGENNYQYKGDYHTPWGIFNTSKETTTKLVSSNTVRNWCNNPDKIITNISISLSSYLKSLKESPLGKTFREIGFMFKSSAVIP